METLIFQEDWQNETIVQETRAVQKKVPTKVRFEEKEQQPLPTKAGKGPEEVIPERRKDGSDSESDPDSSN
jgi:hypothetical protein